MIEEIETRMKGETVEIELPVTDEDGADVDVSTATVKKFIVILPDGTTIEKTATAESNVLSVSLGPTETTQIGTYEYEFGIVLNSKHRKWSDRFKIVGSRLNLTA